MTDADDITRRAREISARAERIAEDASDSQALREELDRLDAELAQLDEEQRRLDEELRDRGEEPASDRAPWAETIVDIVSDVTERISALGTRGWPWRAGETVDRTVALNDAESPVLVVIDNRHGSVTVREGDARTVAVTAELFAPAPHLIEEMTVTAELEGAEVNVRTDWPEHRRGRRARLTVTVPTGTPVRAKTNGGSVSVDGVHGPAAATTRGGTIKIKGAHGDVDARTAGGSVHVSDHSGAVRAATSGGSVHVDGNLTGTVEATTAGGSVHIEGVDRATVTASTSGGSIRVRGRLTGDNHIRTAGGAIEVSIPSDSQVHINGKGSSASSDFAGLEITRGRITGCLGDGHEGTIEFRTSGGSVKLAKT